MSMPSRCELTCSCIHDDEKAVIRNRLLHALALHYPPSWIAINAYAMGRIARYDYPRFWPDLVTQILAILRSAFQAEEGGQEQWRMENSLIACAAVTKELSSVRLGATLSAYRKVVHVTVG
jgi:hypothetical protein